MLPNHKSMATLLAFAALYGPTYAIGAAPDAAAFGHAASQALLQQVKAMARQIHNLKRADEARTARLEQQIAALRAQNARIASAQASTTQSAADTQAIEREYRKVMAESAQIERQAGRASGNNIGATVGQMFAPPTGENYFSPYTRETPEFTGTPPMGMQIGQYGDMRLYMGLQTVGRYQALEQQSAFASGFAGATPDGLPAGQYAGLDPGFQTPFGNLDFMATIPGKMDVFFDVFLSSRPDQSKVYGDQGFIVLKQLPGPFADGPLASLFNYINVKAGAFIVDFGDNNYHRSNNANVQENPLVGNPLVDSSTEEIGAEAYSTRGPVYGLVGLTSGSTAEHFDYGSRPAVLAKIWGYPLPHLRLSASVYYSNLDGFANGANASMPGAGEQRNEIMDLIRSGGVYGGVFGGGWDGDPGQITPLNGYDVQAYQTDLTWNYWPWEMYSFVGWTQDSSYGERWLYGSFQSVYHINSSLYLAGRFSYAIAGAVNGVQSSGWVDRFEVGGGYWLTKSLLAKLEYVYEQYNNFQPSAGDVDAVDAYRNPRFSGIVFETSFAF